METSVELLPVNKTLKFGESQRFTATVTITPDTPDAVTTYKWFINDDEQSNTENYMEYKATKIGKDIIKVVALTKTSGADDVSKETTTEVTVANNDMSVTAKASPATQTINNGETYKVTCDVENAPSGAKIEYLWSNGAKTKSISQKADKPGNIKLKCSVTLKATGFNDLTIESNEVTIVVNKTALTGITVDVISNKQSVEVNEEYTVEAIVAGEPAGSKIEYKWDTGETTKSINISPDTAGNITHSCEVSVLHDDYLPFNTTKSTTVTVEDKTPVIPDFCEVRYVHPLPQRNSAYIWAGWWVMDEIDKITKQGGDWKNPPESNPYICDLTTLAKMLDDFPEVDVQESRHGRIIHRSALDLGIIY